MTSTTNTTAIPSRANASVWIGLLALTIFLSAFLLFQVQPLISKLILPWFGGSPTVWTTAMLFFQCALFGGYLYAHLVTKFLSLKTHLRIHLGLLVLSAMMALMITPGEFLKPNGDENPALKILLLLLICVGLPYFTLASTGPLVQAWFARVYPGQSPYRLYALSNVGSFLALLSFPYVFEPMFKLPQLGMAWTGLYWIFAALCGITACWLLPSAIAEKSYKNASTSPSEETPSGTMHSGTTLSGTHPHISPSAMQRMAWIGLPALASLTMIAVTDHVSHNVAPEPRLWITTLGLYLLTFIITFDHERWYRPGLTATACLLSILFLTCRSELLDFIGNVILGTDLSLGVSGLRWSHILAMFLICFMCHGELVKLRPQATAYLTEFYLCISAGGACGGLFASLIAVNFFVDYYEWPLCLALSSAIALWLILRNGFGRRLAVARQTRGVLTGTACLAISSVWVLYWMDPFYWQPSRDDEFKSEEIFAGRNFYGTISVDDRIHSSDASKNYRVFYSGNITHGIQLLDPAQSQRPLSYYSTESGAGETLEYAKSRQPNLKMALVGLGTGSLAAYGRAQDQIDFYEINPEVIRVANEHFSFIRECKAKTKIILGDGRLKMDEAPESYYDVILLDAFTGGSVPVHLLTAEAFAMYHRHLAPNGFIVVHITNSHLNLYPVVKQQALALGMGHQSKFIPSDLERFTRRCQYFTITNDQEFLAKHPNVYPPIRDENDNIIGRPEPDMKGIPVWTDHFSSINAIERNH